MAQGAVGAVDRFIFCRNSLWWREVSLVPWTATFLYEFALVARGAVGAVDRYLFVRIRSRATRANSYK